MIVFLALITACISLTTTSKGYASERDWEQWDKDNVSEIIDAYWLGSKEEINHRKVLAALTQKWTLPEDHLLEVGCGSGLVYSVLVPHIFPNSNYVGIDISDKMLDIATKRFPEGLFIKDDVYNLSLSDRSFEMVVAFEVFGHIADIKKPISEMFRTTSRLMIFTVWTGPQTKIEHEVFGDTVFIHTIFSHEDIMQAISDVLKSKIYEVFTEILPGNKVAYIIRKI